MRTKQLFTIYLILLGQFSLAQNLIKKEIEAPRIPYLGISNQLHARQIKVDKNAYAEVLPNRFS